MESTELKQQYINELIPAVFGEGMRKYFNSSIDFVRIIGNYAIAFEKPQIETSFCFAHGYCGRSTQEDENEANRKAGIARTDANYFISSNLNVITEKKELLSSSRFVAIFGDHYYGSDVKSVQIVNRYSFEDGEVSGEKLTEEQLAQYIDGLETQKNHFEKRLQAYLKRFGMSKLHVWTFLSD